MKRLLLALLLCATVVQAKPLDRYRDHWTTWWNGAVLQEFRFEDDIDWNGTPVRWGETPGGDSAFLSSYRAHTYIISVVKRLDLCLVYDFVRDEGNRYQGKVFFFDADCEVFQTGPVRVRARELRS